MNTQTEAMNLARDVLAFLKEGMEKGHVRCIGFHDRDRAELEQKHPIVLVTDALGSLNKALAEQPAQQEPDCWAILTPNGSRLVSPDEAKGRKDAYALYTSPPAPEPDPDELTIAYLDGMDAGKKIGAKEGRNKLATWMMQCGFATGHGDTLEELLYELDTEIEDRLAAIREKGGAA